MSFEDSVLWCYFSSRLAQRVSCKALTRFWEFCHNGNICPKGEVCYKGEMCHNGELCHNGKICMGTQILLLHLSGMRLTAAPQSSTRPLMTACS